MVHRVEPDMDLCLVFTPQSWEKEHFGKQGDSITQGCSSCGLKVPPVQQILTGYATAQPTQMIQGEEVGSLAKENRHVVCYPSAETQDSLDSLICKGTVQMSWKHMQ